MAVSLWMFDKRLSAPLQDFRRCCCGYPGLRTGLSWRGLSGRWRNVRRTPDRVAVRLMGDVRKVRELHGRARRAADVTTSRLGDYARRRDITRGGDITHRNDVTRR